MNEDFKDPKVLGGLILAIILVVATFTIVIIERF
jgi:hypothetical protein